VRLDMYLFHLGNGYSHRLPFLPPVIDLDLASVHPDAAGADPGLDHHPGPGHAVEGNQPFVDPLAVSPFIHCPMSPFFPFRQRPSLTSENRLPVSLAGFLIMSRTNRATPMTIAESATLKIG